MEDTATFIMRGAYSEDSYARLWRENSLRKIRRRETLFQFYYSCPKQLFTCDKYKPEDVVDYSPLL